MLPLQTPLQVTFEMEVGVPERTAGWVIVVHAEAIQLLLSVTFTQKVPAVRPLAVAAFPPDGDQA